MKAIEPPFDLPIVCLFNVINPSRNGDGPAVCGEQATVLVTDLAPTDEGEIATTDPKDTMPLCGEHLQIWLKINNMTWADDRKDIE